MPRSPSPLQSEVSKQNGKRSRGRPSSGAKENPALDPIQSGLRAHTIALAHESITRSERCDLWHDYYKAQSPMTLHLVNEAARATLLSDRVDQYRQAELEKQVRTEEGAWNRRQRRRVRYLRGKLNMCPEDAVEQLLGFGQGVAFLGDAFQGLADAVRADGLLAPELLLAALNVCGCTPEPASIGRNPLAYLIQINNLGCTDGIPASVVDAWLDPIRRPAALRDRPRHELMGADPDECRRWLLDALEHETTRLRDLSLQVREDVDLPSLGEALNRVSILTEASARRAARSHTEARVTFLQSTRELFKALDREAVGPLSSVPGPLSAGDGAVAEAPTETGVPDEIRSAEAGPEDEGAHPAGVDPGRSMAPEDGPSPLVRPEVGLGAHKPEEMSDMLLQNHDETITCVEARVSGSGCAKMRKTGAQTAPVLAQTGAKEAADALPDQAPGSGEEAGPDRADEPLRRWTDVVPLSACRREGSLLNGAPEREAVERAPCVEQGTGHANRPALRAGGAKPAQSHEQTRPRTAQRGPETNLPTLSDPTHDPLAALVANYQKEFDAELRRYDHLE